MTNYSAIVLDEKSHNKLIEIFSPTWEDEEGWEILAHHCTLQMGELPQEMKDYIGQEFTIKVLAFAGDDKVKAVEVECPIPTKNKIPHITLAVNRKNGGKPVMSNNLMNWAPVTDGIYIAGTVMEV